MEFLVRMMAFDPSEEKEKIICVQETDNISEFLKLYTFAKKMEIPINIPNSAYYYKNCSGYAEYIAINCGDHESITTLNVWLKDIY